MTLELYNSEGGAEICVSDDLVARGLARRDEAAVARRSVSGSRSSGSGGSVEGRARYYPG